MPEVCSRDDCERETTGPHHECFYHRVRSVGFALKAPATQGNFHRTAREFKEEHFGTSDDRELAKRGIVRASDYGH